MRFFFVVVLALGLAVLGAGYVWLNAPLDLSSPTVDLSIEPGDSAREAAQAVTDAGVAVNPTLLHAWFRASGQSRQIRAGSRDETRHMAVHRRELDRWRAYCPFWQCVEKRCGGEPRSRRSTGSRWSQSPTHGHGHSQTSVPGTLQEAQPHHSPAS